MAYVVCQAIGLETGTAAADYIQLHRGDAKLLLESLTYIRLAATRILDGIPEELSLPFCESIAAQGIGLATGNLITHSKMVLPAGTTAASSAPF